MRRAEFRLVNALAIALLSLLTLNRSAEAQTGARISFGINPTIFRAGQPASAELSVFSTSTSPLTLSAGTNFMFIVDPSLGTVQSVTPPVAVESSSLVPGDFSVSFAGGPNPVIVTYNGQPKTFAYGDSFSVKINLIASAQPGPGKLSLSSQLVTVVNGSLPFTTASIVDFANSGTSAITHDQTLIGDGSSAMPLGIAPGAVLTSVAHGSTLAGNGTAGSPLDVATGGIGTNQLANGAVTLSKIAQGQVVTSLSGLRDDVTLAAGDNITISATNNSLTIGGAPGSTQVFTARAGEIGGLENSGRVVLQKTVPDGNYVITAAIDLINEDADDQTATCTLSTGDSAKIRLPGHGSLSLDVVSWDGSLALLDTATLSAQTTITVTCQGFAALVRRSVITAIKVSSIQ